MAFVNPFRFSTKYEDDETGIIMYPHRPYNPSTGRFLTRDPLGEQSFFIARLRRDRKHAPELWHESLKPGYVFVSNDAVDYIDPLGLNVYKVQTASSHSGSIVDHRQIVGDDGNGGCYVLEYWAKSCSCGLFGATFVGPGELAVSHEKQSASDYISANGLKIVGTVETDNVWFYPASNGSVDSALSRDADGDNVLHQGTYILGWHDCGTIANQWMAHAREVLKQAENSAPGGGDSPDPFGTPGWGF
jgi:RHS repeat-associated protein